ncbi:MAG: response regulator [Kofleriaceae bacterium]|nr:response regulator [Kofleriaceae bacterium]
MQHRRRNQSDHVAVLVVDDDPDARDLMEMFLTKEGYSVRTAANGREALELLQTIRPSLILLDVQMPVMDGMEFREHQRRDRELLSIPTVVLTGAAVEPMLDLAVDEALRKPVRGVDLMKIVRRHCDRDDQHATVRSGPVLGPATPRS